MSKSKRSPAYRLVETLYNNAMEKTSHSWTRFLGCMRHSKGWNVPRRGELMEWSAGYCLGKGAGLCKTGPAGRLGLPNVNYYAIAVEPV